MFIIHKMHQVRQLISIITFTLLLSIIHCASTNNSILIGFNYNTKIQVQDFSAQYKQLSLPCVALIGNCNYVFSLLPSNWVGKTDRILIPSQDAQSLSNYAVEVVAKEITGRTLNLSLILQVNKGTVVVEDRQRFFKTNNFNTTAPQTANKPSPPGVSLFPDLSTVEKIISSGQAFPITSIVSQIITTPSECNTKYNYIGQVLDLILIHLSKLQGNMTVIQLQNQIQELPLDEIISESLSAGEKTRSQKLITQIKNLNQSRDQIYNSYNMNKIISNVYLQKIRELATRASNQNEDKAVKADIAISKQEIEVIDGKLKELALRKVELEEKLVMRRLATTQNINTFFQRSYEDFYREYSEKAIQEKVKFQSLDYEISSLASSLNVKTNSISSLSSQLIQIDQSITNLNSLAQAQQLQNLTSINEIYKNNAVNLQNNVNSLLQQCG